MIETWWHGQCSCHAWRSACYSPGCGWWIAVPTEDEALALAGAHECPPEPVRRP